MIHAKKLMESLMGDLHLNIEPIDFYIFASIQAFLINFNSRYL